ncbi:conserved Plasmodium protein, unknown function [Plasmodium gallinaceum]|uniref:Uncharacterized protein n=1 Tax=Plasmodium gallinaceum TaxID=5849 RepID=A0A1J1GWH8_PLAGA|nr:conserved Plasmodium protein, unknown function [Plasmodium gallinaceum]CRG95661.1 conserved Plasmodium protein, unknown function [Plasmodium gallinaceum]
MSAGAVGVENRYLMKNKKNKNNSHECINVDINHIIKDIYGYKNGRKRNIQFIYDDTIINQDTKKINKKVKTENNNFSNIIKCDNENENKKDDSVTYEDINNNNYCNYTEFNDLKNNDIVNVSPSLLSPKEENLKFISRKIESCIDNILESILTCNEINQAKRIMIPLLSDFIQNNFINNDDYEKNQNSYKLKIDTLQKEKKVLISAVKIQYQKIAQFQKLIENQKNELKKKSDELNQIKAKVHQYFYDINNPNKRNFSILSPDVY